MMRPFGAGFIIGVGVGAGGCYFLIKRLKTKNGGSFLDSSMFQYHPALKHGQPIGDIVRTYQGFVVCYDYKTRNPKWVLEHLTEDSVNGDAERASSGFYEDPVIEEKFRNKLSSFQRSGYDRGHMAPAANYKGSQIAMDQSFSMCNISPQVGDGFNRHYWARLEKFVKEVSKSAKEVYVLTGPLWLPTNESGKLVMKHDMIGAVPSLVSVPTHFYKVVLGEYGGIVGSRSYCVGAFVIPNQAIDKKTPLSTFVVPIDSLEAAAGLKFFPQILQQDHIQSTDKKATQIRNKGIQQFRSLESSKSLPLLSSGGVETVSQKRNLRKAKSTGDAPQSLWNASFNMVDHLCDKVSCTLPSEDWWVAAKEEYERKEKLELDRLEQSIEQQ